MQPLLPPQALWQPFYPRPAAEDLSVSSAGGLEVWSVTFSSYLGPLELPSQNTVAGVAQEHQECVAHSSG